MGRYDDIINMDHHTSTRHPRMSAVDRAAQFSPFAALTGYEDIISETGRLTDSRPELDEENLRQLDMTINLIMQNLPSRPKVEGSRFMPDELKDGGHIEGFVGRVRNIDPASSLLVMTDGSAIPLCDICNLKVIM